MNEEYLRHLFDQEFALKQSLDEFESRKTGPWKANTSYYDVNECSIKFSIEQLEFVSSTISFYIKLHSKQT